MGETAETIAFIAISLAAIGVAFAMVNSIRFSFEDSGFFGAKFLAWGVRMAVFWLIWLLVGGAALVLIELVGSVV